MELKLIGLVLFVRVKSVILPRANGELGLVFMKYVPVEMDLQSSPIHGKSETRLETVFLKIF